MGLDFVPDVLDASTLEALRKELAAGVFLDGRPTLSKNPWPATWRNRLV